DGTGSDPGGAVVVGAVVDGAVVDGGVVDGGVVDGAVVGVGVVPVGGVGVIGVAPSGKTVGSLGSPSGASSSKSAIMSPSLSSSDTDSCVTASSRLSVSLALSPYFISVLPNGLVTVPKPPASSVWQAWQPFPKSNAVASM